jgi:hypothetical protein
MECWGWGLRKERVSKTYANLGRYGISWGVHSEEELLEYVRPGVEKALGRKIKEGEKFVFYEPQEIKTTV